MKLLLHSITYFLLIIHLCGCCLGLKCHPSDEELISEFREDIEQYNNILRLLKEDQYLTRVALDFYNTTGTNVGENYDWVPDGELSVERWRIYKKQFKEMKCRNGIYSDKGIRVRFIKSSEGLSIGGSSKGIYYSPFRPQKLHKSLNNFDPSTKFGRAMRHIEGNWYIYLDWSG